MPDTPPPRIGVLFVCMGNICRSPLAEGVFLRKADGRGAADRFLVESAGTGGWHAGEPADPRVREVAGRHGLTLTGTARRVHPDDFDRFDHLICMDDANLADLLDQGAPPERVRLLLEIDSGQSVREVPDPYYGGADGFEALYAMIGSACEALIVELLGTAS